MLVGPVFGIVRLRDMPVDVFPEFVPPMVEIQTEAPRLSAAETVSVDKKGSVERGAQG